MNQQIASFDNFRAFISAVVAAENTGDPDIRLKFSAAASGLNEGSGPSGGYLVPTQFAQELWMRVYSTGRILARCDRQPLTRGDALIIPAVSETARGDGEQPTGSRFGGAQMYWTDEAAANDDSAVDFDIIKLTLHKLLGMVYATDELVQDVPALVASLKRLFGLEASFAIENAIVSGDGIAKPLGILNSPALITVPGSGAGGAVVYTDLVNMAQRLWGPSHQSAMWLMNNEIYGMLLNLSSTINEELFSTDGDGTGRLLTFPFEVCEYTSATGVAGDLVLADFSQYIVAEKEQNPNLMSSIHVKFLTDESAFKLAYRVDGAPAWKSPITPKNSTLTQSPFVALGARQ